MYYSPRGYEELSINIYSEESQAGIQVLPGVKGDLLLWPHPTLHQQILNTPVLQVVSISVIKR